MGVRSKGNEPPVKDLNGGDKFMNDETYEALKTIIKWVKSEIPTGKLPVDLAVKQVEAWTNEVAQTHDEA